MRSIDATIQKFMIAGETLEIFVPDPVAVRRFYKENPADFPYWSQIWPAAIGLTKFLAQHPGYIRDRSVLEMAAGLGLPSMLAAKYSRSVLCSDYLPEAVSLMQRTIDHNRFKNIQSRILDWNTIPGSVTADVLLLSDVNYDPWVFDKVFSTITRFLNEGTLVLLSTPQRLMAKPFIEQLLPFCKQQEEIKVDKEGKQIPVSILLLDPVLYRQIKG